MKTKDKAIVGILVVLIVVLLGNHLINGEKEKFTTEKWINYSGDSRQVILEDFINRTSVTGMTKEELHDLLGDADTAGMDTWIYYVGVPQGMFAKGEEAEYLVFTFDDEELVEKLENVTQSNLAPYKEKALANPQPVEEEPKIDPNAPVDTLITIEK